MEDPQELKPDRRPAINISVQSWATPIVGLLMLIIGIYGGYFLRPTVANPPTEEVVAQVPTEAQPQDAAASSQEIMDFLMSQQRHSTGNPDAPVTLIGFSDFQWPFCGKFATGAERQIRETYVDTGKVRYVYFHFAFLGQESQWAAEASECAGDQEAFWEYYEFLYSHQAGENQEAFNIDNLKLFAGQLGLDVDQFSQCLDSGKYTEIVQQESQIGKSLGVQSTPTFVINGVPLIGAQPYENFQQVIENALNES